MLTSCIRQANWPGDWSSLDILPKQELVFIVYHFLQQIEGLADVFIQVVPPCHYSFTEKMLP